MDAFVSVTIFYCQHGQMINLLLFLSLVLSLAVTYSPSCPAYHGVCNRDACKLQWNPAQTGLSVSPTAISFFI